MLPSNKEKMKDHNISLVGLRILIDCVQKSPQRWNKDFEHTSHLK